MVKWRGRRRSDNVDDRRGSGGTGAAGLGGLAFVILRFVLGRFGVAGVVVLVGGFFALRSMGLDPVALLAGAPTGGAPVQLSASDEEAGAFAEVILAETEDVWGRRFADAGARYAAPRMVLFSRRTQSGCGFASSALGPFYCPADKSVYLDTAFFGELGRRFGAPGDFAAAYVIAHEVGHHVQTITGVSERVRAAQSRAGKTEQNALQVRMELQADCYAGVWAHDADRTAGILEPGDIEEGLRAASAIGDDTLQRRAGREVKRENFTHGSSEQRVRWFTFGYRNGDPEACDTFSADRV
ncbi:MAG: neutral zinc metallopeptidase [Parvularculaceae bacterium]